MAGDNITAVRNCTLEDIDAACRDFQWYELSTISNDISTYAGDPVGGWGQRYQRVHVLKTIGSTALSARVKSNSILKLLVMFLGKFMMAGGEYAIALDSSCMAIITKLFSL